MLRNNGQLRCPRAIVVPSSPDRWARVIECLNETGTAWSRNDLSEILLQQLDATLADEILECDGTEAPSTHSGVAEGAGALRTFRKLFNEPNPSLERLRQVKEFAKRNWGHPESLLPQEISSVLYFASIAAAFSHLGERISQLPEESLRDGFVWALRQPWVDETMKRLFRDAIERLEQPQ